MQCHFWGILGHGMLGCPLTDPGAKASAMKMLNVAWVGNLCGDVFE